MKMQNNDTKDEGLKGNEKIEEAISALQQEPSQELLAHTLTVIRRRMKEEGQLILAVEPSVAEQLKIQAVKNQMQISPLHLYRCIVKPAEHLLRIPIQTNTVRSGTFPIIPILPFRQ